MILVALPDVLSNPRRQAIPINKFNVSFRPSFALYGCRGYVFNLAFIGFCLYAIYYTILEPFAGLTWTLLSGVPAMWTYNMLQQHAYSYAWAIGLAAHFIGWFMQVEFLSN